MEPVRLRVRSSLGRNNAHPLPTRTSPIPSAVPPVSHRSTRCKATQPGQAGPSTQLQRSVREHTKEERWTLVARAWNALCVDLLVWALEHKRHRTAHKQACVKEGRCSAKGSASQGEMFTRVGSSELRSWLHVGRASEGALPARSVLLCPSPSPACGCSQSPTQAANSQKKRGFAFAPHHGLFVTTTAPLLLWRHALLLLS